MIRFTEFEARARMLNFRRYGRFRRLNINCVEGKYREETCMPLRFHTPTTVNHNVLNGVLSPPTRSWLA